MSSFLMKASLGNELDKVIKEFTGDDDTVEEKEETGISNEDLIAEQKRQAALEQERQVKQAKTEKEREEVRQKIRDKYNLKKKDDISTSTHAKTTPTDNKGREENHASSVEDEGFNPMRTTTNVFNSIKKKFGWK